MNRQTTLSILLISFLISSTVLTAQVDRVKENVRNDKPKRSSSKSTSSKSSSSSYSNDEDQGFGSYLIGEIFTGLVKVVGYGTVQAQKSALSNRENIPNLISFEAELSAGTSSSEHIFQPRIRGNWGIIGTDLRYTVLNDNTGTLSSIDWQVLILRIPIKQLTLNYGIGFTSLQDPQTSYFESSAGFNLSLNQNKLNLMGNYRWTSKKTTEERYRQEYKFTADYQVLRKETFRLSPMLGVLYHNYFDQDKFLLFNAGVIIRFTRN